MRLYLSSYRLGNQPKALLQLLRGQKRTALIFNAADLKSPAERSESVAFDLQELAALGLDPFEVDLRDCFEENSRLSATLASADLIWVRGGNSFVLRRALRQSGADEIIRSLLAKDAVVYGGFSAGIDMVVPSLHGVELVDDPHTVPAGYHAEIIWDCLNLLPYALAPHYQSDHPESADVDKSIEYLIQHHMPFIALRDGEALVVDGQDQSVSN